MNKDYPDLALIAFILGSFLILAASCRKGEPENPSGGSDAAMRKLYLEATDASVKGDFKRSDSLGNVLLHHAEIADNDRYRILGLLCLSYSRRDIADPDERFRYLRSAESLLGRINDDTVAADLYNFMGVCAFGDFDLSKDYFSKSLQAARNTGSASLVMRAECNLAEIYRYTGDTLGIRYDRDIYDFATRTGNDVLRHAAAVRCAEYYMREKSTLAESNAFINEIRDMEGQEFYYHYLKSKWLLVNDSIEEAMNEWQKAYDTGVATPGSLLAGGRLRQLHGDFAQSEELLVRADSAFIAIDSLNADRIEIWRLRARNLRKLGHTEDAWLLMERYASARDSIRECGNSREINAFKVKFETEKKEILISKQKEELRLRMILLCVVAFFLLASVCGFLIYIRRRNRFYRLIVAQQKEFATRQNEYAPYLGKGKVIAQEKVPVREESSAGPIQTSGLKESGVNEENTVASVTEHVSGGAGMPSADKADTIWRDILMEMEKNRIYANPNISRDTFAEKVNTNHTWLTAIIKNRTGKSYTQFINSWRVNEAVKILSQPTCEYTNKDLAGHLGFMTPQSFYNTFRQQMGMSPARFRQDILSVSGAGKEDDS